MEIRTKDKLFLLIAAPLALAGLYFYVYRTDAAKELDALSRREASLVTVEDFPFEKDRAVLMRKNAAAELEAEKNVPPVEAQVKSVKGLSAAERERAVIGIIKNAGLRLVKSELVEGATSSAAALKASSAMEAPSVRRYTVSGTYPALLGALRQFETGKDAVIVSSVTLADSLRNRWTFIINF